ncbi:MAG: hypothetical protein MR508_10635 [Lachnospiraceae bacterium]|nr:hypothetical protein [Lachnospiraceae bacterium]
MKKLQFDYFMKIQYTIPAKECHFTIKCMPYTTERQQISNLNMTLPKFELTNFIRTDWFPLQRR